MAAPQHASLRDRRVSSGERFTVAARIYQIRVGNVRRLAFSEILEWLAGRLSLMNSEPVNDD
jgi:hypothetical protein